MSEFRLQTRTRHSQHRIGWLVSLLQVAVVVGCSESSSEGNRPEVAPTIAIEAEHPQSTGSAAIKGEADDGSVDATAAQPLEREQPQPTGSATIKGTATDGLANARTEQSDDGVLVIKTIYDEIIQATTAYADVEASGNPMRIDAARDVLHQQLAAIRDRWRNKEITLPFRVSSISRDAVRLEWSIFHAGLMAVIVLPPPSPEGHGAGGTTLDDQLRPLSRKSLVAGMATVPNVIGSATMVRLSVGDTVDLSFAIRDLTTTELPGGQGADRYKHVLRCEWTLRAVPLIVGGEDTNTAEQLDRLLSLSIAERIPAFESLLNETDASIGRIAAMIRGDDVASYIYGESTTINDGYPLVIEHKQHYDSMVLTLDRLAVMSAMWGSLPATEQSIYAPLIRDLLARATPIMELTVQREYPFAPVIEESRSHGFRETLLSPFEALQLCRAPTPSWYQDRGQSKRPPGTTARRTDDAIAGLRWEEMADLDEETLERIFTQRVREFSSAADAASEALKMVVGDNGVLSLGWPPLSGRDRLLLQRALSHLPQMYFAFRGMTRDQQRNHVKAMDMAVTKASLIVSSFDHNDRTINCGNRMLDTWAHLDSGSRYPMRCGDLDIVKKRVAAIRSKVGKTNAASKK